LTPRAGRDPRQGRRLGRGDSGQAPPEQLDAAIFFAIVGELVPPALKAIRKGGRAVCAGIHMSGIEGAAVLVP
jgi:propanol-preferring alcohol dehydrogenase